MSSLISHISRRVSKIQHLLLLSLSLLFVFSFPATANQHTVGDVTIHYNALNSALISPEVASQYGITRSGRTAIVNISVMKNDKPVVANIFGHGKNLTGQLKELAFKEIKEEEAIYYIATLTFSNAEKLSFDLQVQAEKAGALIPLQFKQQLFTE